MVIYVYPAGWLITYHCCVVIRISNRTKGIPARRQYCITLNTETWFVSSTTRGRSCPHSRPSSPRYDNGLPCLCSAMFRHINFFLFAAQVGLEWTLQPACGWSHCCSVSSHLFRKQDFGVCYHFGLEGYFMMPSITRLCFIEWQDIGWLDNPEQDGSARYCKTSRREERAG